MNNYFGAYSNKAYLIHQLPVQLFVLKSKYISSENQSL